jgi:hypothetical protein
MRKSPSLGILLIITLSLSACKAWYKAGADEGDLTAARQRCEDETRTSAGSAFVECMERAGWHHARLLGTASDSETGGPSDTEIETSLQNGQRDKADSDKSNVPIVAPRSTPPIGELSENLNEPAQAREFSGWIQVGEGAAQLGDAKGRCDEAGVPRKKFYDCMKDQGWRPVGIRLSVEEPGDLD